MNRRSLARDLVRHALEVMPPERRPWALAMAAELDHIEDDGAALGFALGAVWTGYNQAARIWPNWLRLGRLSVAFCATALGLGMFYMSVLLERVPEAVQPSVPFSSLMVLLGCGYIGAGWGLARRRLGSFVVLVGGIGLTLSTATLAFAAGLEAAIPLDFYLSCLRGEKAAPQAYYAALLLEQFAFVVSVAGWGALFWRLESRRVGA